jgi:hypothetical protein
VPRFSYQETMVVPAQAGSCLEAASRALTGMGGKPTVAGLSVVCDFGSQVKMRLVGGAFCPVKWLPIEVNVYVTDDGTHRQVVVNVADRLGLGTMFTMEQKYREHCRQTAACVRDAMAASLGGG